MFFSGKIVVFSHNASSTPLHVSLSNTPVTCQLRVSLGLLDVFGCSIYGTSVRISDRRERKRGLVFNLKPASVSKERGPRCQERSSRRSWTRSCVSRAVASSGETTVPPLLPNRWPAAGPPFCFVSEMRSVCAISFFFLPMSRTQKGRPSGWKLLVSETLSFSRSMRQGYSRRNPCGFARSSLPRPCWFCEYEESECGRNWCAFGKKSPRS